MKLLRFLCTEGREHYGLAAPDAPEMAELVTGAPFGRIGAAGRRVRIARLLAPVAPPAVFAAGLNYRGHAAETSMAAPVRPVVFIKAATSVIGPGEPILLPHVGPDRVDYEGELAVVLGRTIKNAGPAAAAAAIAGYTCANDVSARDWQMDMQQGQWARGKSFDTFCPLGPCLVTPDELPDPHALRLRTLLNGRVVQEACTAEMLFTIPELVSDLSQSLTLPAGTVILTGTPEGVGFTRQPPLRLRPGDEIAIEIEGIGILRNPVAAER